MMITLFKKRQAEIARREEEDRKSMIRSSEFHTAIKPKNRYFFFGDYFVIDNDRYGTILTILHNEGSDQKLSYFWGLKLFMRSLIKEGVSIRLLYGMRRQSDFWVDTHSESTEAVLETNESEAHNMKGSDRQRLSKNQQSFAEISKDIAEGGSYLRVQMRYLIKANSLEELDDVVRSINRQLRKRFETVKAVPYVGSMKQEHANLLRSVDMKEGKGFMFTSQEFAGFYNLMTHGIEDESGEYIGIMTGDVNNNAVMFDLDDYKRNVVIASSADASTMSLSSSQLGGQKGSDMWGVKLCQNALQHNHRVVQIVLNNAQLDRIGLDLSSLTAKVDMTQGDLNMFEVFGSKERESALMEANISKIVLMYQMMSGLKDHENWPVLEKNLTDELLTFYIDLRLWSRNIDKDRGLIRLTGLPHDQYPLLARFNVYLKQRYAELKASDARDEAQLQAVSLLSGTTDRMLTANGDLFNRHTKSTIDGANSKSRVLYDFSSLRSRSDKVAMAQLANVFSYAVGSLTKQDVLIIHGVEYINDDLKPHIQKIIDDLYVNGVRVVFVYGSSDKMLDDIKFNELDKSDYSIIGSLTTNEVKKYETALGKNVPSSLVDLVSDNRDYIYYVRRGLENVVMGCDLSLGVGGLDV